MKTRLVQKHLLRGTQQFDIVDDTVVVVSKQPMRKEETLTVMLSVLNSEPVIGNAELAFTSRVNNEPLLSLFLAKPNPEEFNAFVNLLKERIQEEYRAFAGLRATTSGALPDAPADAPPEFGEMETGRSARRKKITSEAVGEAIRMLRQYVDSAPIGDFLTVLEALEADPDNPARLNDMLKAFDALGPSQGAVLSYAPYVGSLLSDDPFENM